MSRLAGPPLRGRARRAPRVRRPAQLPLGLRGPERIEAPVPPSASDTGSTTLGERLDFAWSALTSSGRAECPVCRGPMESSAGVGRCGSCGSSLR